MFLKQIATKGFTLIEVMMVLAMVGILATLSVPAVQQLRADYQSRQFASNFEASLNQARNWAKKRNTVVRVSFQAGNMVVYEQPPSSKLLKIMPEANFRQVPELTMIIPSVLKMRGRLKILAPDEFYFCGSSTGYYRTGSYTNPGIPYCAPGNLAQLEKGEVDSNEARQEIIIDLLLMNSAFATFGNQDRSYRIEVNRILGLVSKKRKTI